MWLWLWAYKYSCVKLRSLLPQSNRPSLFWLHRCASAPFFPFSNHSFSTSKHQRIHSEYMHLNAIVNWSKTRKYLRAFEEKKGGKRRKKLTSEFIIWSRHYSPEWQNRKGGSLKLSCVVAVSVSLWIGEKILITPFLL